MTVLQMNFLKQVLLYLKFHVFCRINEEKQYIDYGEYMTVNKVRLRMFETKYCNDYIMPHQIRIEFPTASKYRNPHYLTLKEICEFKYYNFCKVLIADISNETKKRFNMVDLPPIIHKWGLYEFGILNVECGRTVLPISSLDQLIECYKKININRPATEVANSRYELKALIVYFVQILGYKLSEKHMESCPNSLMGTLDSLYSRNGIDN